MSPQELIDALVKDGIVPDIIDAPSPTIEVLQVKYPSGVEVRAGNELTPTQVKDLPSMHLVLPSISTEEYSTLVMIDPDAPSRAEPTFGPILHWLVINIPADGDVTRGEHLVEYRGSGPSLGSGLHRYIFLAYKQSGRLQADAIDRRAVATVVMPRIHFKVRDFVAKHNLSDQPIAANFFQAQYDDYVPIARASVTDWPQTVQQQHTPQQQLIAALQEHGVVPDVLDAVSPTIDFLQVKYPCGVQVHSGNELTPTQVKDLPNLVLPKAIGHEGYTTLLMIDPDAPSCAAPTFGEILHWLVVNIPANGVVSQGETIAEYIGCGAPKGTGLHRYIFLVFKHPEKLDADAIGCRATATLVMPRRSFKTRRFQATHKLTDPIAANFFRAQYDDYVPIFRAAFTDRPSE